MKSVFINSAPKFMTERCAIKLLPIDKMNGEEIIYYNKKQPFQMGMQIVLYFFDTKTPTSMEYIPFFIDIMKSEERWQKQNFYAFVTEQHFGSHLNILQDIPKMLDYNIILDNETLSGFLHEKSLPQVLIYTYIGRFSAQLHPKHHSIRGAIAKKQINKIEDFEYMYDKAVNDPQNIVNILFNIERNPGLRYDQKLRAIHSRVQSAHPKINLHGTIIQQIDIADNIPQLRLNEKQQKTPSKVRVTRQLSRTLRAASGKRTTRDSANMDDSINEFIVGNPLNSYGVHTGTTCDPLDDSSNENRLSKTEKVEHKIYQEYVPYLTRKEKAEIQADWKKARQQYRDGLISLEDLQKHSRSLSAGTKRYIMPQQNSLQAFKIQQKPHTPAVLQTKLPLKTGTGIVPTENPNIFLKNNIPFTYGFSKQYLDVQQKMSEKKCFLGKSKSVERSSNSQIGEKPENYKQFRTKYYESIAMHEEKQLQKQLEQIDRKIKKLSRSISLGK